MDIDKLVEANATPIEADTTELDEEREKHRKRAEKFGVDYRDPGNRREFRDESRKEKFAGRGFATGFDIFAEEEVAKRQQRASRFNMPGTGLDWQPPERPEDEERKKQRAERFGVDYQAPDETGLMEVDLYEERKDVPLEAQRRSEAVHVYGIDLLSTNDILSYFKDYGPSYVEWINDSSANVLFMDGPTAKRAIAGLGKPLPPDELPEGVDAGDPSNIELLWHKGEDFVKAKTNIPLIFRTATVFDVKPSEKAQSRRLWVNAGGGGGGGANGRGRGRGRKNYKVRRSGDGVAYERPSRGWQHDDRVVAGAEGGGGGGDGEGVVKGRGQRRFKRKSGDGRDVSMSDAMEGNAAQRAKVDDNRELTRYDDL